MITKKYIKMKLLFKSIGVGIFISILIYMAIAILAAILAIINDLGGFFYVMVFIFLIAIGIFNSIYYYQNK